MRVPSTPPSRISATSVVPPPMSMKMPPSAHVSSLAQALASAYGWATAPASSRSSSRTTVSIALMCVIGANVLKTVTSRFLPVKPTGLVTGYPSTRTFVIDECTRRASSWP